MVEKRKHEDTAHEDTKSKKLKKAPKHTSNSKSKNHKQNSKGTENSAITSTNSQQSEPSRSVLKDPNVNKDNTNKTQTKSGKKWKMWKHWEKRKKQKKNKEIDEKDVDKNKQPSQISTHSNKKVISKSTEEKLNTKMATSKKPTEPVSSNWKKLKMDLKKSKPKKNFKKKSVKKSNEAETKGKESPEPDIWFDDVDEELLKPKKDVQVKNPSSKPVSRSAKSAAGLVKEHAFKGLTKAVALDCEMVGVGEGGKESVLARVSVVNQYGECLYDTYVRSREDVVDYRTQWSGVTPEKLENATDFLDAQKCVSDLLRGRILVGHAVHHDLEVLFLDHPRKDIRDTSGYKPYKQMFKGRTPSLKNLTSRLLDVKIQTGEHNSVTDAQAAMRLYTFSRKEWEGHLKKRRIRKPKTSEKIKN